MSALTDRTSLEKAKKLFPNSGLYIPSSTYSWLSRSKLIEVRKESVKHSLISKLVRKGDVYPAHLPDIYDELSRQIMFRVEHNVALTDLRGLMLSAHLKLPILILNDKLINRISEGIGINKIESIEARSSWLTIRDILELYRELIYRTGKKFQDCLKNGASFSDSTDDVRNCCKSSIENTVKSVTEYSEDKKNSDTIKFHYFTWNILPDIHEYFEQNILEKETIRNICEKCVLLIAEPIPETDGDSDL